MKILIVNKFYYSRGGDCTYCLNLEKMLSSQGHEVAFFSMQYPENLSSRYEVYFPEEVSFTASGVKNKVKAVQRLFSSKEVQNKFTQLLQDFKPDVVHLNNIHSYLSPVVAKVAKQKGVKVVWTLHDYKLICPSYSFLCHKEICEACLSNKYSVITNRCFKNSYIGSLLAYCENIYWSKAKLEKYVDHFICPSQFMANKMIQAGFDNSKVSVINNFININHYNNFLTEKENYYCYVGRLSSEKGIETLLDVAQNLPYKLKVAGNGPLFTDLSSKFQNTNIEFLGQLASQEVLDLLSRAKFSVISSECYENNPFSVIESLCVGTPVLGSQVGGIPELINSSNGRLFTMADKKDLHEKIIEMFDSVYDHQLIQQNAIKRFNDQNYLAQLEKIYL